MRKVLSKVLMALIKIVRQNYIIRELGGRKVRLNYFSFVQRRALRIFPKREASFADQLALHVPKVDVLIDVGANLGLYLFEFSKNTNLELVGYEPDDMNYSAMKAIRDSNFADKKIVLESKAISNMSGSCNVVVDKPGSGGSNIKASDKDGVLLDCLTLDEALEPYIKQEKKIGILMDIEGHEFEAMQGFNNYCESVNFLAIELHQNFLSKKDVTILNLITLIQKKGFILTWLRVPQKGADEHGQTHAIFERCKVKGEI